MKITVDIDCTPAEARAFFGLPDFEPMQKAVLDELEPKIKENMAAMVDPEGLVKTWFSLGGQSFDQFQKMMAATMAQPGQKK
ncbi:MAG: DUF6489 family protein [Pseudomonadota bacterium]